MSFRILHKKSLTKFEIVNSVILFLTVSWTTENWTNSWTWRWPAATPSAQWTVTYRTIHSEGADRISVHDFTSSMPVFHHPGSFWCSLTRASTADIILSKPCMLYQYITPCHNRNMHIRLLYLPSVT